MVGADHDLLSRSIRRGDRRNQRNQEPDHPPPPNRAGSPLFAPMSSRGPTEENFNVTDPSQVDHGDLNRLASAHEHDWCTWIGSDSPTQNLSHGVV